MKSCRHCKLEVHTDASRCPHCQGWQGRLPAPDDPRFIWPTLLLIALCFAIAIGIGEHYRRLRPDTGALVVASSRLAPIEPFDKGDLVRNGMAISGQITNNSSVAWKNFSLELRFLDGAGNVPF
jgi:hypothetical protein